MRRSARVAAAVDARTSALPQLPVSLAARVFRFLPVDDRARAALVCRGWRAFLADAALWTRLDLPSTGGVARERITDAFLRGAAAMARGQLQWLDLGLEDFGGLHPVTQAAVLEVVAANAGSLRELCVQNLHTPSGFSVEMDTLEALARTAPLLRRLKADVVCSWQDAARLLRAEPPFASLQLCTLTVVMDNLAGALQVAGLELVSPFAAALADTALLVTMSRLDIALADIQQPEVLDALVDALLPSRLPQLAFWGCKMAAPAPLARLLRGSSLTCLACNSTAGGVRPGRPRPSAAVRVSPSLVVRRARRPCVVHGRPRPAARPSGRGWTGRRAAVQRRRAAAAQVASVAAAAGRAWPGGARWPAAAVPGAWPGGARWPAGGPGARWPAAAAGWRRRPPA
jgi:hypothetical protein